MKSTILKISILLAIFALIIWLDSTGLKQKMNADHYRSLLTGTDCPAPAVYLGICIVAPNLMFPYAVIIIAGGIIFGPVKGILLSAIGGCLSAVIGYYIARFLGRKTIEKYFLRGRWQDVDKKISNNSILAMLIIRTIGVPFCIENYLGGILGVSLGPYLIGSLIGMLPWIIALTIFGESLMQMNRYVFFMAVLALISVYTLTYLFAKKIRQ